MDMLDYNFPATQPNHIWDDFDYTHHIALFPIIIGGIDIEGSTE